MSSKTDGWDATDKTVKKWTGYITRNGKLYLFESPDDLRAHMIQWGNSWSQCCWIEGTVFVHKGDKREQD